MAYILHLASVTFFFLVIYSVDFAEADCEWMLGPLDAALPQDSTALTNLMNSGRLSVMPQVVDMVRGSNAALLPFLRVEPVVSNLAAYISSVLGMKACTKGEYL